MAMEKKIVLGSGGIRTHASEETGALNQRLRPLGHATLTVCQGTFDNYISEKATAGLIFCLCGGEFLQCVTVYGHIMLKAPVLVRSLKLSNIESR